jgi:oxygen-independent coproporphyrinogen-3 oxidase
MVDYKLIQKYNIPIPRYTSYPTVPYWKDDMCDEQDWQSQIQKSIHHGKVDKGISLYIHLPFCEQLCTYCGCNKRITKNHGVESIYIEALLKEWEIYKKILGEDIILQEVHLGGGTPTFFSPENLKSLLVQIKEGITIGKDWELSFEGHPNNTTFEHLKALYDVGSRRVSFGVQDMDTKVQIAINRVQPFSKTKQVVEWAREIGYTSVNFDLIYGLPFQTEDSIRNTISSVITLMPDRIAFYSYAHVPWTKKSQRAYDENDLPKGREKYNLYALGKDMLLAAGFDDVGMDHFALQSDAMLESKRKGTLHRNFMGYTTLSTDILVGLGVSAISDVFYGYRQNYKTVEEYYEAMQKGVLPIHRGINLTDEDVKYRQYILDIACKGHTTWEEDLADNIPDSHSLQSLKDDGLILYDNNSLQLTPLGWSFLRNVCSLFDKHMLLDQKSKDMPKFSQAI